MNKEVLPIGSVVLLKGGTKRLMITGFCSIDNDNTSKVYDYTGCIYPEGIINSNEIRLFDDNQIDKVYFRGFEDDEQIQFRNILEKVMSEYSSEIDNINQIDEEEPVIMYESETDDSNEKVEESLE